MKRLFRAVFLSVLVFLFVASATNFAPAVTGKAIPASAQQNRSKRVKKSKTKSKVTKTKSRPLQRRQRKQRKKPA